MDEFKCDLAELSKVRAYISDKLANLNVAESDQAHAMLAVSELFTNLVKHSPKTRHVFLRVSKHQDDVDVDVFDDGGPFEQFAEVIRDTHAHFAQRQPVILESGAGLYLVSRLFPNSCYVPADEKQPHNRFRLSIRALSANDA